MTKNMHDYISAPAPRLILRMLCLHSMIRTVIAELPRASEFVEIGSGLGDTAHLLVDELKPSGVRLYELSDVAREKLENRFRDHVNIDVCDEFNESVQSCDVLAVMEVLEHIEDDNKMLKDIHSSLTTNGWLIGSVPAYSSKWQDSDEMVGHFRRYDKNELVNKLLSAGFDIIDLRTYGFPFLNAIDPVRKLYYKMALRENRNSMTERTSSSGVSRGFVNLLNDKFVLTLCKISDRIRGPKKILGRDDGFIFICRKA